MTFSDAEIIKGLRRIAVKEKQELQCLGCGYEHNCSLHGCRIIKTAADRLEELVSGLDTRSADQMFQDLGYRKKYENAYIRVNPSGSSYQIEISKPFGVMKYYSALNGNRCSYELTIHEALAVAQLIREMEKNHGV